MEPGLTRARPRPALLRALGKADPPERIELGNESVRRIAVLKHDSWAATAIYQGASGTYVCKFNRRQPILFVPMGWLGRLLARRETYMLDRLRNVQNIPDSVGPIKADGKTLPNAAAHAFIPGHPLGAGERVGDTFFPELIDLLTEMHRRGMAYVDLHKRENIIVGDDGRPYLVDFQIGVAFPDRWPWTTRLLRAPLRILQRSDAYHLGKHVAKCRPDLWPTLQHRLETGRPWWIRLHRAVAVPFRTVRRSLLVLLGVRRGRGRVHTEHFPEDVVRHDALRQAA